jgi:HSP20 family molecular chaperone IbpA
MAAEVKAPPSPWIRGFSTEPDGFWTACKYMYGRVFNPSQTPIRVEAYIKSHQGDAGLIGTDQYRKYSSRLTTSEGKQIPLQPSDFHITFDGREIKPPLILRIFEFVLRKIFFFLQPKRPKEDPWVLPSSLFNKAKENNIVQFRWEGTLYEYRLKQLTHSIINCRVNFESCFLSLQAHVEHKARIGNPYLFEEDIPQEYSRELGRLFSEKAQIYSPANKTLSPLTSEKLRQLTEHKSRAERVGITHSQNGGVYSVNFDAAGISEPNLENIILILEDNYLAIFLYSKDKEAPKGTIIVNEINEYTYRVLKLGVHIDPRTLHLEFQDGVGRLTFKACAQTASLTES